RRAAATNSLLAGRRSARPDARQGAAPAGRGRRSISRLCAVLMSGMRRRPRRLCRKALYRGAGNEENRMKYMILTYASQQDYDALSGKPGGKVAWSAEDFAAMGAFMESFNSELAESGELVETRGLAAPVHARRLRLQDGVPVVTDGPYAET